jgi:hypothetical protein
MHCFFLNWKSQIPTRGEKENQMAQKFVALCITNYFIRYFNK